MGKMTTDEVVDILTNAGIRCARGYPGERMPQLQKPAVAVNPEREEEKSITLAVHVLSPVKDGARVCEDFALRVTGLLRQHHGVCVQEACRHDGRGDRFSVRILAQFAEEPPDCPFSVHLGGQWLRYAVRFAGEQQVELEPVGAMGQAEAAGVLRQDKGWRFTLEERYPPNAREIDPPAEPFLIQVRRGVLGELYDGCRWQSVLREDTPEGLRLVRVGRAGTRSVLTYG